MFRKALVLTAMAVLVAVPAPAQEPAKPAAAKPPTEKAIDLVICLDVSGSMNGLIDSAKLRLWDIVNEMARLKPTPNLRVGLYSYGHTSYPADKGWVKKDVDLTADLDDVYKALNALTINGGEEYVARVTQAALNEQKWTAEPGALKIIFVCGNEPANQDKQVGLDAVAAQAKKDGVVVNTIYCNRGGSGEEKGWSDFAALCGGKHMAINQNRALNQVVVKTEFDAELLKLSDKLNTTYVTYGTKGAEGAANQVAQDSNALRARGAGGAAAPPAAALSRAASKATALYNCASWDLVDKMKEKDFDLSKIKEEDLCEEIRKIKPEERMAYLKKKSDERESIRKEINDLSAKRAKKVDEELAKLPKDAAEKALDEAVRGVVREQAEAKGFKPAEKK